MIEEIGDFQINAGLYLLKKYSKSYKVKRMFGRYNLYHNQDGFIVQAKTQRQLRNAVRAYEESGERTTEGRE